MFSSAKVTITTNASGAAEVFLSHGENRKLNGFLACLIYTPGTIAAGADLTITTEDRAIPILTKADVGASMVVFNPRALLNAVADGAEATSPSEYIPIKDERIKVAVAQGGSGGIGSIEAILINQSPY